MEVLKHQREALDEIVRRARAYFRGDWRGLPVLPRWASIMIGPTGTGKTAVAMMAAAKLSEDATDATDTTVSLCRVAAPNWMPSGAYNRGTKETIILVAEHVVRHDRTMLFVDEIDKLIDHTGDNSWKTYIRGELFDLCDGRWPAGITLPETDDEPEITIEALTEKLRNNVFIVAAGTFQSWFDTANTRRDMGFGAEINPAKDEISADIIAEKMPRELANRFNGSLIRLPELREEDYRRIAHEAETKLPERMQDAFRVEVAKRISGAIAAKKGVRFLEEAMMEVLKNLPPKPFEIVKNNPDITNHDLCTL